MKVQDIISKRDQIEIWISENESNAEIATRIGCARDTLYKAYKIMGINYKGNMGLKGKKTDKKRKSALELIKSPGATNHQKRKRLIEDGLKENRCECCGLSEWMGKPIPLELHHKDGNHWNNDLENLQILCANCHMQAHDYNNNKKKK